MDSSSRILTYGIDAITAPVCTKLASYSLTKSTLAKLSDAAITAAAAPLALGLVAVVAVVLAAVRRKRRSAASAGKVEQPPML